MKRKRRRCFIARKLFSFQNSIQTRILFTRKFLPPIISILTSLPISITASETKYETTPEIYFRIITSVFRITESAGSHAVHVCAAPAQPAFFAAQRHYFFGRIHSRLRRADEFFYEFILRREISRFRSDQHAGGTTFALV